MVPTRTSVPPSITRSLDAYLRMPDVAQFLENSAVSAAVEARKHNPETVIPEMQMKTRPLNVKEAAALYRLHELMFPDRKLPAKYDAFAVSYKNPSAGTAEQAPAEAEKKQ